MADDTEVQVPILPESANSTGQQAATAPAHAELIEGQLIVSSSPYGGIAESLRGLAPANENLSLSRAARAMLATAVDIAGESHRTAIRDAAELRAKNDRLQTGLADLREKHATTCAELRGERSSNNLRSLMSNVGAGLIGLIPFAAEKGKVTGGLICGLVGGLLLLVSWLHARSPARSPSQHGGQS